VRDVLNSAQLNLLLVLGGFSDGPCLPLMEEITSRNPSPTAKVELLEFTVNELTMCGMGEKFLNQIRMGES